MTNIATNTVAKLSVAFVTVAMLFTLVAPAAQAQEADDLQAQIASLLAQIAQLEAQLGGGGETTTETCEVPVPPMTIGSQGANVTALQELLIGWGEVIPAGATGYFGSQTQAALASWQAANGVAPAVGYYGPITQGAMESACTVTVPDTDEDMDDDMDEDEDMDEDDMTLSGEGTLEEFDMDDEETEVQEGEDDVVVASVTLEADDGDIEMSRMTFELADATTGTINDEDDPWDVFTEVALWVDGDKVASFEADDEDEYLDEDEGEFRFTNLDMIVEDGEEVEVLVAVSVMNSVDGSDDADEDKRDWELEATEVRYFDADGVASDDSVSGSVTFVIEEAGIDDGADFESNSNDPDDTTLQVDDNTDESDEYDAFIFDIDVGEDSSDLVLTDAYVAVTVSNPASNDDIMGGQEDVISDIYLTIDGEKIEGEAVDSTDSKGGSDDEDDVIASSSATTVHYLFEFDDLELEADEEYESVVSVVFEGQDGGDNYEDGVTIDLAVDGDTAASDWEAEGLEDDNLIDGSETSGTHTLQTAVPQITGVDSTVDENDAGTAGTISYEFTVDAEDADDDVTFSVANNADVDGASDDVMFTLTGGAATSTATATLAKIDGDATYAGGTWTVAEGDTATFALDVAFDGTDGAGTYRVTLESVDGVDVDETSNGMSLSSS